LAHPVSGAGRWAAMPSSVIRTFDYDPADQRLDVLFVSGKRYSYLGVPQELAQRMREAFSKGVFFNRHIRGRFDFRPKD
jgi:hypothetical protein